MRITVNGEVHDLPDRASSRNSWSGSASRSGVALAVNGTMLPRSQWTTSVEDGWTVEVLTAVQGG